MNTFLIIVLTLIFVIIPAYSIATMSSTYYKKVYKNKENIKYTKKIKSLGVYLPSLILGACTICFAIYAILSNPVFLVISFVMLTLTVVVFACISLANTKFYIFDNYIVSKSNYIEFSKIKNIVLKKSDKENIYEFQVVTKDDLHSCPLEILDSKSFLKEIKSFLPKNIKISETDGRKK